MAAASVHLYTSQDLEESIEGGQNDIRYICAYRVNQNLQRSALDTSVVTDIPALGDQPHEGLVPTSIWGAGGETAVICKRRRARRVAPDWCEVICEFGLPRDTVAYGLRGVEFELAETVQRVERDLDGRRVEVELPLAYAAMRILVRRVGTMGISGILSRINKVNATPWAHAAAREWLFRGAHIAPIGLSVYDLAMEWKGRAGGWDEEKPLIDPQDGVSQIAGGPVICRNFKTTDFVPMFRIGEEPDWDDVQ